MPKTTIFFAGLSLLLAIVTGLVTWRLLSFPERLTVSQVGGASIKLGLPSAESQEHSGPFRSASALLWDSQASHISFEQNGFERRSIASLTKLMTAMVALDRGIKWDQEANIQPEEYVQGGRLLLHEGEVVTMRDLLAASLLGSANNATLAYVRQLGADKQEFVREMNRKAVELGLEQTEFVDVTGLDPGNVSTAYEVARLAEVAFNQYPEIAEMTSRQDYSFTTKNSGREHTMKNTNKLPTEWGIDVSGSKTGYLYESRFCLVVQGEGEMGNRIAVLLGSPSEIESFAEMKKLLQLEVP